MAAASTPSFHPHPGPGNPHFQQGHGGGGFGSSQSSKLQLVAPVAILYGGYVTLYIMCIYIIVSRRKPGYIWQIISSTTLFVLATLSIVSALIIFNDFTLTVHQVPSQVLIYVSVTVPILSYIVADCILIHRCYLIWEGNFKVIIPPSLLLISTIVIGFMTPIHKDLMACFFSLTLATNLLVTGLSAAKIIFVARKGVGYLRKDVKEKYITAVNLILESGLIYSAALTAGVIFGELKLSNQSNMLDGFVEVFLCSTQLSGILPTLLIVWVGLRRNMRDDDFLGDMRPLYDATDARPISFEYGSPSQQRPVSSARNTMANVNFNTYLPLFAEKNRYYSGSLRRPGSSLQQPAAALGRGRGGVSSGGMNRDIEEGYVVTIGRAS